MRKPLEERFWEKVDKTPGQGPQGDCWVWSAHCTKDGYGRFQIGKKFALSHRVSWELTNNSEIPTSLQVCHRCDNPPCVNPKHFFLGTQKDNMKDCSKKGRLNSAVGERQHNSKLTIAEVRSIRYCYNTLEYPQSKLSKMFQVSQVMISRIVLNKNWKQA